MFEWRKVVKNNGFLKKEKGIVLLSCLVFLLLILGMVRFALTSSRLEERKAGVDYEMLTARQSAQTAIRQAERYILDQGIKYCIQGKTVSTDKGAVANAARACRSENKARLANLLWSENDLRTALSKIGEEGALDKGIYTQTFIKNHHAACQPLWTCVDWGGDAKTVRNTIHQLKGATTGGNALTSIVCKTCNTTSGIEPRYIIERFTTTELNNLGYADNKVLNINGSNVVVLRITAVGFGNGNGGAEVNTTNAIMQATYVL